MKISGIGGSVLSYKNTARLQKQMANVTFGAQIKPEVLKNILDAESARAQAEINAQKTAKNRAEEQAKLERKERAAFLTKDGRRIFLEAKYSDPEYPFFKDAQAVEFADLARIQEELEEFPDIKRQLFLTPDNEGRIPLAVPLSKKQTILDMFARDPETIKDMLLSRDKDGNLPIHTCGFRDAVYMIYMLKNQPEALDQMLLSQNNDGETPLHSILDSQNSMIDRDYIRKEKARAAEFLLDAVLGRPDTVRKMMTTRNNKGEIPLNMSNAYMSSETGLMMLDAVQDDPETLSEMLLSRDNDGEIYAHKWYIKQDTSKNLREWLKDRPETLKEMYTAQNKDGKISAHFVDLECTQAIIDTFRDDPETLKRIFLTKDKNGRLPAHHPVKFDWRHSWEGRIGALAEAFEGDFDTLKEIFLTKDNFGNLPLHYACKDDIGIIIGAFKDRPEILREMLLAENNEGRIPVSAGDAEYSTRFEPMDRALSDFPDLRDEMYLKASKCGLFGQKVGDSNITRFITMTYRNKPEILAEICLNAFPVPDDGYTSRPMSDMCYAVKDLATNSTLSVEKSVELLNVYSAYKPEFKAIARHLEAQ